MPVTAPFIFLYYLNVRSAVATKDFTHICTVFLRVVPASAPRRMLIILTAIRILIPVPVEVGPRPHGRRGYIFPAGIKCRYLPWYRLHSRAIATFAIHPIATIRSQNNYLLSAGATEQLLRRPFHHQKQLSIAFCKQPPPRPPSNCDWSNNSPIRSTNFHRGRTAST